MEEKYLTITQLNRYIKFRLDQDPNLNSVFLKGEISNFKAHTRGHFYFTLKDEGSRINAVMFAGNTKSVKFVPMDGMKVLVRGKVSVYEASGAYQIYVEDMMEDGVGNLYIEFEKLKKRLSNEGLFDPAHKKKIPKMPRRIGVITASTGAAIKDILTTLKRRWPIAEVYLFPSLVQGGQAAVDIIRQIERSDEYNLDVLIIGRGGGSIEDLWCFNDEMVARAIYKCKTPTISAVGHEIDFTISDFVADLRAPTPTAAAEMAVPNKSDIYAYLRQVLLRVNKSVAGCINLRKTSLEHIKTSYVLKNPMNMYLAKEEKFDRLYENLKSAYIKNVDNNKNRLKNIQASYIFKTPDIIFKDKKQQFLYNEELLVKKIQELLKFKEHTYVKTIAKLEVLNPLLTIKRGYSIVKKEGQVIDSVKKVKKNDIVELELKDGIITSKVI